MTQDLSNLSKAIAALKDLTTAHLADAVYDLDLPLRLAPAEIRPLELGLHIFGPVRPFRHVGSVDIGIEAIDRANPGDVLVMDNQGRTDEGGIGDLLAGEAKYAGMSGAIIWGAHRDTRDILEMNFPIFSSGACSKAPDRMDPQSKTPLERVSVGNIEVTPNHIVCADYDGIIFILAEELEAVVKAATDIRDQEGAQAEKMKRGTSLREQFQFDQYLKRRGEESELTFRKYLREIGYTIER